MHRPSCSFGISLVIIASVLLRSCSGTEVFYDVVVIGGGAGGTAAGIQSARSGASTLVVEPTPWLGGMLTSAGVSAIDGNYRLRGGLFGEFCDSLANRYGGYDALKTGWVSNILFEPKVGAEIFMNISLPLEGLSLALETECVAVKKLRNGWRLALHGPEGRRAVKAGILIDGTELGDIARQCGVPCNSTPVDTIAAVQDLTYVITVQDFGPDSDKTIQCPDGYDPKLYSDCLSRGHSVDQMLSYGALPGGKIMLNWPISGNDCYVKDITRMLPAERAAAIDSAKRIALGYLYYIQTELGRKNIGIAEGEYPTEDGLPMIPYYRDSRRIEGEVTFTLADIDRPYSNDLYRTSVAVGDYPVDHHHYRNPDWRDLPQLEFHPVPSFSVPFGVMVPKDVEDLLVIEKAVSVTCIANGATRLQPVGMEIGQAAGVAAALLTGMRKESGAGSYSLKDVQVRDVQEGILAAGGYLLPYLDIPVTDPRFAALQRIGATGIMRGEGRSVGWSNETWFRIDDPVRQEEIFLEDYYPGKTLSDLGLPPLDSLTRGEYAVIIDSLLHPFESHEVTHTGALVHFFAALRKLD